ncbi:hypothetical protein Desaci_4227 [Desulfosporosinus acidiphilus SJ4]|uniref:Uncharacterized protein n=1 Tax=Desulfosporosinus acidiphilus (strain DSM 22704 / JCM 16185 / SJ4) TaxID=646529 RepID=I4DBB0_DESAJ|nr:hypothetical protein Desaci_4227 [Desulfosporosinus acidiphilus SJ4]
MKPVLGVVKTLTGVNIGLILNEVSLEKEAEDF